jgi:hypothetical protein
VGVDPDGASACRCCTSAPTRRCSHPGRPRCGSARCETGTPRGRTGSCRARWSFRQALSRASPTVPIDQISPASISVSVNVLPCTGSGVTVMDRVAGQRVATPCCSTAKPGHVRRCNTTSLDTACMRRIATITRAAATPCPAARYEPAALGIFTSGSAAAIHPADHPVDGDRMTRRQWTYRMALHRVVAGTHRDTRLLQSGDGGDQIGSANTLR